MTLAQVIALINSEIIPNNNNEITANVLRPILIEMLQQPNDLIGDLSTLTTADNSNIVNAINELQNDLSQIGGINIFQGVGSPNNNPPAGAVIADFYSELDVSSSVVGLWIYDGNNWVRLSDKYISSDYPQALTPGEQQQGRDNIYVYSRDEVDVLIQGVVPVPKQKGIETYVMTAQDEVNQTDIVITLPDSPDTSLFYDLHIRGGFIPDNLYTVVGNVLTVIRSNTYPWKENKEVTFRYYY